MIPAHEDHATPCPCPLCSEPVSLYMGAGALGYSLRKQFDAGRFRGAMTCPRCKAALRVRPLLDPVDGRSWEWAGPRPEPMPAPFAPAPTPEPEPEPEPESRRPVPFRVTFLGRDEDRLAVGTVWAHDLAEAREQARLRHPDFDPERIDVEPDPALAVHVERRTAEVDAARAARKRGATP